MVAELRLEVHPSTLKVRLTLKSARWIQVLSSLKLKQFGVSSLVKRLQNGFVNTLLGPWKGSL